MFRINEAQYNWPISTGTALDRTHDLFPYWIIAQYFGELNLTINGADKRTYAGTLLILPPDTPHSYYCENSMRHHWIHIENDLGVLLERYRLESGTLYSIPIPEEISEMFRVLSITYHERRPFREEFMSLKIEELIARVAIQLGESTPEIDNSLAQRFHELRAELLEHSEENWSVSKMAKKICLSESYFFPLYKTMFGDTPAHDLASIRIERACTMLRYGFPVEDAAEKCGYSNVFHFIRQFKKMTGVTPGQYRKKSREPV